MTGRGDFIKSSDVFTEGNNPKMSDAKWCDIDDPQTNQFGQTGHSFSAKDPERRHFAQTAEVDIPTGNSYGTTTFQRREEITDELDMCGYHWRKQNPFLAKKTPEIPAGPSLADLEEEDANYRRGYEAAEDRYLSERENAAQGTMAG